MAKPEWGVKRQCAGCGVRFYDLMHDPIVCPECGTVYEIAALTRGKRARPSGARAEAAKKAAIVEDVEALEVEDDDTDADVVLDDDTDDDDDAVVVAPVAATDDEDEALDTDDGVLIDDEEEDDADDALGVFDEDDEDADGRR